MKLATVIGADGDPEIGVLVDDARTLVLLQAGALALEGATTPYFDSMLSFLRAGPAARYKAHAVIDLVISQGPPGTTMPLDQVSLLAPVPVPESIRDCMAFEQHIINAIRRVGLGKLGALDETVERLFGRKASLARRLNKAWYDRPIYYKSNRFSVVGHEAEVCIPAYADCLDYELEWGVFIGAPGEDIPERSAADHIAGYAIFNDFSARDIQLAEMAGRLGPAKGKDFNTGNVIGPWLVTPDEIPDPYALAMSARVNGEEWSRGSSADMHWTFERMIAYISRSETLYPGEFIGSGTCSGPNGRGCGLELGRFLQAGDVVELEVEKIGVLRNTVVLGPPRGARTAMTS